jgi:hypothetical protein
MNENKISPQRHRENREEVKFQTANGREAEKKKQPQINADVRRFRFKGRLH